MPLSLEGHAASLGRVRRGVLDQLSRTGAPDFGHLSIPNRTAHGQSAGPITGGAVSVGACRSRSASDSMHPIREMELLCGLRIRIS